MPRPTYEWVAGLVFSISDADIVDWGAAIKRSVALSSAS